MLSETWRLQDAKNRFSKVVEAALHGEPLRGLDKRGKVIHEFGSLIIVFNKNTIVLYKSTI